MSEWIEEQPIRTRAALKRLGLTNKRDCIKAILSKELKGNGTYKGVDIQNFGKKHFALLCIDLKINTDDIKIYEAMKLLEERGYQVMIMEEK